MFFTWISCKICLQACSLFLALSLDLSSARACARARALSPYLSSSLYISFSLARARARALSLFFSQSLTLTLARTHSLTRSLTYSLACSLSLSFLPLILYFALSHKPHIFIGISCKICLRTRLSIRHTSCIWRRRQTFTSIRSRCVAVCCSAV